MKRDQDERKDDTTYVKFGTGDKDRIRRIAKEEGLQMADVIRRAVLFYFRTIETPEEVSPKRLAGDWFAGLPVDVRRTLYRIGSGLALLGDSPLDGIELPAWVDTAIHSPGDEDKPRKSGGRSRVAGKG